MESDGLAIETKSVIGWILASLSGRLNIGRLFVTSELLFLLISSLLLANMGYMCKMSYAASMSKSQMMS
jgi:high-affinity Fe2+/Pb2+ permease